MNNEYYRQVLQDVQKDLGDVEQSVSELQAVERYVQRKMEADTDEANGKLTYDQYQALLDDVRKDVDQARSKIGELRGVGNFAREKLQAAGVNVDELEAASAKKPAEEQDQPQQAPSQPAGKADTMQTVQFGPDGFPIT